MPRLLLSDELWSKLEKILLQHAIYHKPNLRMTYVKAHQHSSGAASGHTEGLGKSRAGLTSKIHLAVDAQGLPVAFEVTGGEVHDSCVASKLRKRNSIKD